jgi:hypothetical protein
LIVIQTAIRKARGRHARQRGEGQYRGSFHASYGATSRGASCHRRVRRL